MQANFKIDYPGFTLDVSLTLPDRGVSALFGPSGCGKTTCLRAMAGLERIPHGHFSLGGEVWQDEATGRFLPTHQRPLGLVFQEASLFEHLDVRRNVEYGLRRIPARERRLPLAQAVALLGIAHLMDRRPATLSGGERQRVAIARALATSPRLLLLDEPLAALDARRKDEVLPYLERLHRELDIPVVLVTHALDEVMRLADTLVVLEAGRVVAAGPVAPTVARADVRVMEGEDAGALIEATVAGRDAPWHLLRVTFSDGELWLRDSGVPVGQRARVRILARDVSLATEPPRGSSIQNLLPCTVRGIAPDAHPSQVLVQLACGDAVLVSRVTARAADALGLTPGMRVWAQVKAAALIA